MVFPFQQPREHCTAVQIVLQCSPRSSSRSVFHSPGAGEVGALSLVVFVMTALAMPTSRAYFSRFYGGMHPLLAVTIASAVGAGSLRILQVRAGFQILAPRKTGRGIAVSAVACLQLYVLRRFDFASMYTFRLIYYGYWHIAWGVIRLEVLF